MTVKQSTKCVEQSTKCVGEPVGEVIRLSVGGDVSWFGEVPEVGQLLYTTPYVLCSCGTATGRQQRKPLSEAAIEGLAKFVAVDDFNYDFARAIEKAHGITSDTDFKE